VRTALGDLRKLAKSIPWWGWIIVVFLVFAGIGALGNSGSNDSSPSPAPSDKNKPTPTQTATQAATQTSKSKVDCLPDSVPQICSIANDSFDQPLQAVAGHQPDGLGIDYLLAVDTNQSAQQVAVQSFAQMDLAYQATVKQLQGKQISYVAIGAYDASAPEPANSDPLLATSIGPANVERIASGTDPIDIWRLDVVSPPLQPFVGTP
jgi:hypothetical protein